MTHVFDIGIAEMVVLGVIALVVVGPRDLPRLMRTVGNVVRKVRGMANEFKAGMNDLADEVEREADPFREERAAEGLTPDMSPEDITAHIMGNKQQADRDAAAFTSGESVEKKSDKKDTGHGG